MRPPTPRSSLETQALQPQIPFSVPSEVVHAITEALRGLRFGSVQITVHQGRIVQIERHERIRFPPAPTAEACAMRVDENDR